MSLALACSSCLGKPRNTNGARLTPDTHPDLGALLEPLSVAIHAHTRAATGLPGARVLVMGAGAVGLLCAAVSKAQGARAVVVADVRRDRLDFALRHGFADGVVEVPVKPRAQEEERMTEAEWRGVVAGRMSDAEGVARMVKGTVVRGEELGEVDLCFEGTGVESSLQTAIYVRSPHLLILPLPLHVRPSSTNSPRPPSPAVRSS